MKKTSNEHHAQRPKWQQLALRFAAAVAIFIGTGWWVYSALIWLGVRMFQDQTTVVVYADLLLHPGVLLVFSGYFGLLFLDAPDSILPRNSRLPRNPAPGELWRWRVNRAMRLLRGKLWAVSSNPRRSLEDVDELTLRLERLRHRYFPSATPPPPRRYRKLSDY